MTVFKNVLGVTATAVIAATAFTFSAGLNASPEKSPEKQAHTVAFSAPTDLVATLSDSQRSNLKNVELKWTNRATASFGNFVQVDLNGTGNYIILAILESNISSFVHPDLVPETKFTYRVQPFFGPVSNVAEVTAGKSLPANPATLEADGPLESKEVESANLAGAKKPVRTLDSPDEAAPANLSADLISPTTVVLKWKDRSSDEDGYLLEGAPSAQGPFQVMALLPPGTTSFRQNRLPPETKCCFRVRAFVYGEYSNLAYAVTPEQPLPARLDTPINNPTVKYAERVHCP